MTAKLSQVGAVVKAVTEVLGDAFVLGTTVVSEAITEEQKARVRDLVKQGILNGEVSCNKDTSDQREFHRYVNGMINNHFNRSKALNGGKPYNPKKKGVSRDKTLKELNKYLETQTPGTPQYKEALAAVDRRKSELSSIAKGIDTSVAPQEVQNLINQQ